MKIGELARHTGVRTSAIRYYEAEGLLPAPPRVGGRREYDASALMHLRLIHMAQRAGFTLAETRTILRGVGSERPLSAAWRRLAEGKLVEIAGAISRLTAMHRFLGESLRCACVRAEDCELLAEASDGATTTLQRAPARRSSRRDGAQDTPVPSAPCMAQGMSHAQRLRDACPPR